MEYLEWMEKWDRPTVYWPSLTIFWISMFLFYIWSSNILLFYSAIGGTIGLFAGVYIRNQHRKKKMVNSSQ